MFEERELAELSVVKESLTTAADGKNYATKIYNLDVKLNAGAALATSVAGECELRGQEQFSVELPGIRAGCFGQTESAGRD
jgi:hypothetical protein